MYSNCMSSQVGVTWLHVAVTSEDNICRWDDFVISRGQLYEEGIWREVKEHFLHLTPAPLPHLQELAGSPIWAIYIIYAMRVFVGNDSY